MTCLQSAQHIGLLNGYNKDFGLNPVGKWFATKDV